jgi:hypothetical protein
MRLMIAIVISIVFNSIIHLLAWAWSDEYADVAVPFLIGVSAALLAEIISKGDD